LIWTGSPGLNTSAIGNGLNLVAVMSLPLPGRAIAHNIRTRGEG
jgi:hypothetical protein